MMFSSIEEGKDIFREKVSQLLQGQKHYCSICDDEKQLYISYVNYDPQSDRFYAVIKCAGCLDVKDYVWSKQGSTDIDGSAYGIVKIYIIDI